MTRQQAVDAILAHFADAWADTTPIAWDNIKFTATPNAAWVRISVQHNVEQLATVANGLWVRAGIVFLQLFVPAGENQGRALIDTLAPQAQAIFETSQPFGIDFRNVTAREVGISEQIWFQTNITAEFEYSEIR